MSCILPKPYFVIFWHRFRQIVDRVHKIIDSLFCKHGIRLYYNLYDVVVFRILVSDFC